MVRLEDLLRESGADGRSGIHYHPQLVESYLEIKKKVPKNVASSMTLSSWANYLSKKEQYKPFTDNISVDLNVRSKTLPVRKFLALTLLNACPLPGLTTLFSVIEHGSLSKIIFKPFLN